MTEEEAKELRQANQEMRSALNWIIGFCWFFKAGHFAFARIEERAKKALREV